MKRALMVAVVGGLMVAGLGCEEKKADSLGDKLKQTGNAAADKMKDAGTAMKDAGAAVADKTKDMANAATDKVKAEVKDLMDNLQKKVDTLSKGGESLKADQKGEFDKAMAGIKSTWTDMSKSFDGLKDKGADAMATGLADLKTKGLELMDKVKATAAKFNINLG